MAIMKRIYGHACELHSKRRAGSSSVEYEEAIVSYARYYLKSIGVNLKLADRKYKEGFDIKVSTEPIQLNLFD